MTGPLSITVESLAEEAGQFQRKLGAGLGTLREMEDVHFGATDREEVWRDGRVVLYRYRGERTPTAKVPMLVCYALVNRPYMVEVRLTSAAPAILSGRLTPDLICGLLHGAT